VEINDANSDMDMGRPDPIPEIDDGQIIQINQWEAHKDVIKSIQYISLTDVPLVFTAGLDRMAYIWDLDKVCRGKLIQGYMLK
jgi:WD40 repeat protein